MEKKLKFDSETILNYKIPLADRGAYEALAVDSFLDEIVKDYETIEESKLLSQEKYESLINEIDSLKKKINQLEIENISLKNKLSNINENDTVGKDNIRLVQRINVLERFIWQNGHNPDTIK